MRIRPLIALLLIPAAIRPTCAEDGIRRKLEYAPAPVDNPLKGLVPYAGENKNFPHSIEFDYLRFSSIVKGYDDFDWKLLEKLLDDVASRGHQTIFRIYLEYPDQTGIIPEFLIKDGLKVHKYLYPEPNPVPIETPDYENKNLRQSLKNFIAALGKKYDGDPRIGFITAGLLGIWGEWHNYPKERLFASKTVQSEVMDAYEAAFKITPVLLRYPAGKDDNEKADNSRRKFGYHDDSFAWATLATGKRDDEWFYMSLLKAAGPDAESKWKSYAIGGEIRPEAWGHVFDKKPSVKQIQDFRKCVEETHVTWLMDSGMFEKKQPEIRVERARTEVRRMGYEFHVSAMTPGPIQDGKLTISVELENRGVAPFYYDWPVEIGLIAAGKIKKSYVGSGKLIGLLPGKEGRIWKDSLNISDVPAGKYQIAVRIANPLKNGPPLRFANVTQDAHVPGWLTLIDLDIR